MILNVRLFLWNYHQDSSRLIHSSIIEIQIHSASIHLFSSAEAFIRNDIYEVVA